MLEDNTLNHEVFFLEYLLWQISKHSCPISSKQGNKTKLSSSSGHILNL